MGVIEEAWRERIDRSEAELPIPPKVGLVGCVGGAHRGAIKPAGLLHVMKGSGKNPRYEGESFCSMGCLAAWALSKS